jgi:pyruvate/2-oxoglutarate dehydrogenase complex dihydrolipoamide acyltransferase (E2) component
MAEVVKLPKWGLTMEEATIKEWLLEPGEAVEQGDVIATVESEKAEIELPSPVGGVFAKALVADGQTVPVGTDLAVIAADADEYESLGGG